MAEVRDGLFRPTRELPTRFLADHDATSLRRRLERLSDESLGAIEAPLVEAALGALPDTWPPRAVVHFAPAASRAASSAIAAAVRLGALEAYVAVGAADSPTDEALARIRTASFTASATRIVTDVTTSIPLPRGLARPRLLLALGNALGAFGTIQAIRFLRLVQATMHSGDRLVLGVDLRRDARLFDEEQQRDAELRAAYHLHVLHVIERDLGADVDRDAFAYRPRYDAERRRVEHRLVATEPTRIEIPGLSPVQVGRGDGIVTAVSCTFERTGLTSLLAGVGLSLDAWFSSPHGEHAVALVGAVR